ncbi:Uu.00g085320.m01.CDS01 [Anthostomella pinea]|uniref:Uu.00g085320.m01.CDS01 n=1 Tax=Anthostomella pinea TaxID=933095 RepID=A0AAI8VMV5_9PEZI|nr:Uu.00g085320.m01.CDS01 [Anthostomella pinea]
MDSSAEFNDHPRRVSCGNAIQVQIIISFTAGYSSTTNKPEERDDEDDNQAEEDVERRNEGNADAILGNVDKDEEAENERTITKIPDGPIKTTTTDIRSHQASVHKADVESNGKDRPRAPIMSSNRTLMDWNADFHEDILIAYQKTLKPNPAQLAAIVASLHEMGYTFTGR